MLKWMLLFTSGVLMVLSSPPAPVRAEGRHLHSGNAGALVAEIVVSTEPSRPALDGGNQEQ